MISACGPADTVEVHERLVESAVAFLRSQNPRLDGVTKEDLFEATKHPRTSIAFFADPNYNVSESLTATAATAAATTSSSNNNNKNEMNDDKEKDPLTTALEGMSVSEYIRWRSGGTDDDIKRSGVSFTKNETDVLLLNKK